MRITDLLQVASIEPGGKAASKGEVIDRMVKRMAATGKLSSVDGYREKVLAREKEGTTGIGDGIAIPHGKGDAVREPALAAMTLPDGVDFAALDGRPVRLIFMIAAPDTEDNVHLAVLSRLSALLMDADFRKKLMEAKSPEEFLKIVDAAETAKFDDASPAPVAGARLIAVTACPTGIAHTYMAAEALEQAAKRAGVTIKVETDGSGGVERLLTPEDIRGAECVIIAADRDVETARFDGKPVLSVGVAEGIRRADALIGQALSGSVPVFRSGGRVAVSESAQADSVGRRIYKNLMNGVSHMLPFVIGGGILIALSFLLDGANAGKPIFGNGTPVASFFNQVGGLAFGMMFPVLAGFIAMAIGDRPALMIGMVGGLIARTGLSVTLPPEKWQAAGFFGALAAGFIAGYLVVGMRRLFSRLPRSLEGTKPVLLYPFLGILAIGALMVFVVDPPMAWVNNALYEWLRGMGAGSRVLLGLVLGGMMSIDFGGPINKTAYVFGTASIAEGQSDIMAAVMVGGMVPPIAISFATMLFKNRFTEAQRGTCITNLIMGASFITEGAIPFAAADPLHVIPACAIGSAAAGGLSMLFGCASPAPHGGIFVVGIVHNPMLYVAALLAGSLLGAVLLGLLKKPVAEERG